MSKTKTSFYTILLLVGLAFTQNIKAQAPPLTFTDLGYGAQSLDDDTVKSTGKWYKWVADTGVIYSGIRLKKNGTSHQLAQAELYTVSSGSLVLQYTDTLETDTTMLNLYAGYISAGEIYIHLLNAANSCTACTVTDPVIQIEVRNIMLGCNPVTPCDMVNNGDLEYVGGVTCGVISGSDISCWQEYQGTADCLYRGCTAVPRNDLGTNVWTGSPVIDSHNPASNDRVFGFIYQSDWNESSQTLLNTPLVNGRTYQVSLWAYNFRGNMDWNSTVSVNSDNVPCWLTLAANSGYSGSLQIFPATLNTLVAVSINSVNVWIPYTYTVTYSGGTSDYGLKIGSDYVRNGGNGSTNRCYIIADDISILDITQIGITPSSTVINCANSPATVTLTASNSPYPYTWQPGGIVSNSIVVSPSVTTVYTVSTTSPTGCTAVTKTYTVNVLPLPVTTISATPSASICPGASVSLSTPGLTFSEQIHNQWTPCSSGCTTASLVVTPTTTTTYTVKLYGANGCTNTAQATVTVLTPSNAISITGNTLYCSGQTTTLTANGGTSYTWSPGGATTASISISPTVTTTYTVNGTYACGTASAVITVSVASSPTVTASASPTLICIGQSSTLTASGATSYSWNPGGYTTNSVVVTPSVTTTYSVTGTTGLCSSTRTVIVGVNPPPSATISPVTSTICAAETLTLSIAGKNLSILWSTGATTSTISVSPTITTVYTATVTNGSTGCSTIKSATVYAVPNPTVSVGSYTICAGMTATVTAGGATSYTWNTGANTSSIVVTPSVTTVYTVTGENTGCSSTSVKTGTVTVLPALPGSLTINTSSTSPVIANGTGFNVVTLWSNITNTSGLVFEWYPGGATTPTTSFNLTQPEVIQLNVYNNYCGSSVSSSVCLNYVAASCANSYTTLNNATLTNTASLANGTYFVTGTLTINWTTPGYALENKTFIMATGSKVEVSPTSRVTFNSMKFYSCDGMWQGIELKTNGTDQAQLTISGDNNVIEDAYRGVYCINPGTDRNAILITEEFATFNKNYIDIYIENTKDASQSYSLYCSKTKFLSQSSTTSPGGNLKCSGYYSPTVKARSYAGVYGKNAGIIDLNTPASPSTFNQVQNKDYGFCFDNTNANVCNANFYNAVGVANSYTLHYAPVPSGVGVYSKNSEYLNIKYSTSPGAGIQTTFDNVGYGVITNNTYTVDVQDVSITSSSHSNTLDPVWLYTPAWGFNSGVTGYGLNGVFATNARDVMRVNSNVITDNYYPVTVNYTTTPSSGNITSVAQNTITTATAGGIMEGVSFNSAVSFTPTTNNMRIAANTFTNVNTGVKVTSTSVGLRISNNTFTLNPSANSKGIHIAGSNSITADNNTIYGAITSTNAASYNVNLHGVLVENSPGCKIQCNTITKTGIGVEYRGGNSSSGDGFYNNTLQYPIRRGLFITNGGIIGTQGSSSGASNNQWTGSWPAPANADPNKTSVGGTLTGGSQSDAANSPLYVHNNSTELPDDNYITSPSVVLNAYSTSLGNLITTASGSYTSCPATLSSLRVSQTGDNNLEQRDSDFVNYVNNLLPGSNTDISPQDKFMLRQYMFKELSNNPSNDHTLINFMEQEQNSSVDKYHEIDSLLAAGNLNAAGSKNVMALQSNDITQTQNAYNTLYLNGINSQSDLNSLSALADLCPQQYGTAVYQARALLQTLTFVGKAYTDSCYNKDLSTRLGYDETKEKSVSTTDDVHAKLYPNPNNGTFMLAYDLKANNDADITIFDITGKTVFNDKLDKLNNVVQINISNLQSGIYFVQLSKKKNLLWTDKLMISK